MNAIIIVILFAVWNGIVIKWKHTDEKIYSIIWHGLGFVIRGYCLLLIYPDWLLMLIYANIAWTVYDMVINVINGWNLFYIGNTSVIDKVFGKWLYICKGILLLTTIIYAII